MKIKFAAISVISGLISAMVVLLPIGASAQIQQAWVAKYNNSIPNGTHQAVKMVLDAAGNIYVTGFSQNTNGNLDYVTVKYNSTGNQVWATRFDSTNTATAKPAGMVLDTNGNVIVTGSAVTVKYDNNGNQLWTAPYAGTALAVDTNGNICITGFSTNFGVVKLSSTGTNLWLTTYADVGPTIGQALTMDAGGNVYVSGSDSFMVGPSEPQLLTIKYDYNGNQIWHTADAESPTDGATINVVEAAIDTQGNLITVNNENSGNFYAYISIKYSSNSGAELWHSSYPPYGTILYNEDFRLGVTFGLALDSSNNVFLTGQEYFETPPYGKSAYGNFKLNTNGVCVWTNNYPQITNATSAGTAIAVDSANNVYVTGYSQGTNFGNDIVTLKYDNNGNMLWLERYNGPGNGDDEANAIAVDASGNVYVTGYETVVGGGTEMVTIKYSPGASLQMQPGGNVLLQTQGNPGETFDFQASTNLQTWLDLGTTNADPAGAVQFLDTNASNFNYRFYLTTPHP